MYAGFIYEWTNIITGKKYIGRHKGKDTDSYVGSGTEFNKALDEYGIENFERVILEYVEDSDMIKSREQYYLDTTNAAYDSDYYNRTPHAGGGWDHIDPKDCSRRLKEWRNNNPHPRGMKDKVHSEKSKQLISERTAAAIRNKPRAYNPLRPVEQYTIDGVIIAEHDSLASAARAVGGNASNIKYTIEGRHKHAYSYKWKYKDI
jgi:group I intron endonuclease